MYYEINFSKRSSTVVRGSLVTDKQDVFFILFGVKLLYGLWSARTQKLPTLQQIDMYK